MEKYQFAHGGTTICEAAWVFDLAFIIDFLRPDLSDVPFKSDGGQGTYIMKSGRIWQSVDAEKIACMRMSQPGVLLRTGDDVVTAILQGLPPYELPNKIVPRQLAVLSEYPPS